MPSGTDGGDDTGDTGDTDYVDNVDYVDYVDDGGQGHDVDYQSTIDNPGADDGPVTADPSLEAVPSWEQMDALTGSGAPVDPEHAIGGPGPSSRDGDDDG